MNTTAVELNNISELESVKTFKDIIQRIRNGYTYKEIHSSAGLVVQAIPKDKAQNLPSLKLIFNFLGEISTVRFEATGNLSHYVIEEIMIKVFPNLKPIEIELTELETGRVRIHLNKKKHLTETLYPTFKKRFFSYYANEEGRLLILLDDEPEPTSSIAITADPLKIRPKTTSYSKRPSTDNSLSKMKSSSPEISETIIEKDLRVEKGVVKKGRLKKARKQESDTIEDSQIELIKEKKIGAKKGSQIEKEHLKSKDDFKKLSEAPRYEDLSKNEKIILDLIDSKPKKKVQSKGLKKELSSLEQTEIKDILRSLVNKGFLYVEAAWYLRKDPNEVIENKSDIPLEERLKRLNAKEKKVFDILNKREGNKAQARMLIKGTKMSKDNIKKILRDMVAKDVLYVEAAWYIVKK